jgi:hypothetical protein
VQETRSDVSEATVVNALGSESWTSVFPGPFNGYVETGFSSAKGRYYYKGSKEKSFKGQGGFSTVEQYGPLVLVHNNAFSAHVTPGNLGLLAAFVWEGLGLRTSTCVKV